MSLPEVSSGLKFDEGDSDSDLIVKLHNAVVVLEQQDCSVHFWHVRRHLKQDADALAYRALDKASQALKRSPSEDSNVIIFTGLGNSLKMR